VRTVCQTVTRQRRDCDLNPGPTAPESSTLTTRLPSHPGMGAAYCKFAMIMSVCVCLSVCLSVCPSVCKRAYLPNYRPNFINFAHVMYGRGWLGPLIVAFRYAM